MDAGRSTRRAVTCVILGALALVLVTVGSGPAAAAKGQKLGLALCAPDENTFTLGINNAYFPLLTGAQWVFTGKESRQRVGLRIRVLDQTEDLYGSPGTKKMDTRVVEEIEWFDADGDGVIDANENLIEFSLNYFAQTTPGGTVCYFGEIVDIYDGGVVVSHAGSWRADGAGNAPGIFMPALPKVGMTWDQEAAPGVAEDQVTVLSSGTVTVPAGTFANAIRVRDVNPLDGSKGVKWYAPGVGLVVDGPLTLVSSSMLP